MVGGVFSSLEEWIFQTLIQQEVLFVLLADAVNVDGSLAGIAIPCESSTAHHGDGYGVFVDVGLDPLFRFGDGEEEYIEVIVSGTAAVARSANSQW